MPDSVKKPIPQQPINGQPSGLKTRETPMGKILLWVGGVTAAIIIGVSISTVIWYNVQLAPVGGSVGQLKKITIAKNTTLDQISKQLQDQSIIRNSTAFVIYTRLSGKGSDLRAGTYRLSPAETTPQIISHLVKGSVDQFSITFYPGATLVDNTASSNKYDITTVLKNAGYSDQEIAVGFRDTLSNPSELFVGSPVGADFEGYIYGETYNFSTGATVQDILLRAFDQFYKVIQDNNFVSAYASHGLNLYQGITLASIIQREASNPDEQKQVAQVFYSRLKIGMQLGSDVTYQYIADKTGVARDPNLNSPYNTRRFTGLPPGPIAVPGLSALQAVASPAGGDYLYFLSGDDDVMYFAHTDAEHGANIVNHCEEKCSTP